MGGKNFLSLKRMPFLGRGVKAESNAVTTPGGYFPAEISYQIALACQPLLSQDNACISCKQPRLSNPV